MLLDEAGLALLTPQAVDSRMATGGGPPPSGVTSGSSGIGVGATADAEVAGVVALGKCKGAYSSRTAWDDLAARRGADLSRGLGKGMWDIRRR